MGRKWKIGIIVLLLLTVGLYASLRLGFLSEPLKRLTLTLLTRHVPWPIEIGRFGLRLIPSALILSDVKVLHTDHDREPLLEAKEVYISFSPWSLLTEVTVIKKIRLTEPHFVLVQESTEAGQTQWFPPPREKGPISRGPLGLGKSTIFIIRKIEIQQGALRVQSFPGDLRAEFTDIDGEITPDLRMREFQVHLTSSGATIQVHDFEKHFDRAELKLSLQPDRMEIRKAHLETSDIQLAIGGDLENLTDPQYTMTLDASFPLSEIEAFLDFEHNLTGQAQFHGKMTGQRLTVSLSGDARISNLAWDNIPIGELNGVLEYNDQRLLLSDLTSSSLDGQAQGHAMVDLATSPPSYQLSLTFERLSAGTLAALLGRPQVFPDQILEGRAELSGQGLDRDSLSGKGKLRLYLPQGSLSPEPRPVDWNGWINRLKDITTQFELEKGVLYLKEGMAQSPRSQLQFQGRLGLHDGMDLAFHLISQEAHEFTPLLKIGFLRGAIDLKGTLRGTLEDPKLDADGTMRQATIRGRPFKRISAHLQYQHPKLVFTSARFREKRARYELNGSVSFDASLPKRPFFNLEAKIAQGLPREIAAIFYRELPITSAVSGDLKARGHPKKFQVTADLTVGPGRIYGQEVDSGQLELTVTHQKVSFEKVKARYRDSIVTGEGWIRYDRHFNVAISSSRSHLNDIAWARKNLSNLSAVLSGNLQGRGLLKHPEFTASARIQDFQYNGQSFGDGTFTGTIANETLMLVMELDSGLSTKGTLTLASPFPFNAALSMNTFQARPILNMLDAPYLAKVSVEASGSLTAQGTLNDLGQSTLVLHLNQLSFDLAGYLLSNAEDSHIEMTGRTVEIKSLELEGKGTRLSITGGFEVFKSYGLIINGKADLDLLRVFRKEITLGRGIANLAIQILDRWEDPEIRGNLTIQDGTLKSRLLNQALAIQSMNVLFSKRQIILESFEGKVGGGKLTVSGKWDMIGFSIGQFGLNLELKAARIAPAPGLSASVDASLLFHGNEKTKFLKGEVIVQRASYDRPLDWQSFAVDFSKRERREPQPVPMLGDVVLNIQVLGKKNIKINNNLAKLPLEIDLLIKGTINQPVFLGRIEARGGTIFFMRNDFKILSGAVDFINPERIQPILDIKATARVRDYQAHLSLIGPMDRLELTLSSDPPLGYQEILALLAFGKTPEEVAESSMEIGAAQAVDLLTSEIQIAVEEKLKAFTGLDRIHVDPYFSSAKAPGTPRVTVSKRLNEDRLIVTYQTTFDPSEEEVIQIEYIITNNISLVGGRDELGRVGGDLKFRFEFR